MLGINKLSIIKWWKKSGYVLRASIFFSIAFLVSLAIYWNRPEYKDVGNNLLIFSIVNFNLVLLILLAFLVGRNVVKLIFDRRRRILGSKLRLRLVTAFVGLTLVPTIIVFVLASGLLSRALDDWFSNQVETAVHSAMSIGRNHYELLKVKTAKVTEMIKVEIETKPLVYREKIILSQYLEKAILNHDISGVQIFKSNKDNFLTLGTEVERTEIEENKIIKLASQKEGVSYDNKPNKNYLSAFTRVRLDDQSLILITTKLLSKDIADSLRVVSNAFKEYEQVKLFKSPIKSSYLLTLAMITGLLLFSAIWFGFYTAKEISVPIQRLAEGTQAVARGNLDYYVRPTGDDEVSVLIRSFNQMTADLKQSRNEVERRRSYTETILSNLAIAVISVDKNEKITSANRAATSLFSINKISNTLGQDLEDIVNSDVYSQVEKLVRRVLDDQERPNLVLEKQVSFKAEGISRNVVCTSGQLTNVQGEVVGAVLLFDDVTELKKAQEMNVWSEVARRIAHEIKNPLTPIKLCAQRIEKNAEDTKSNQVFIESSQTILEHVESINRLANEFSRFARMPKAEFKKEDINILLSQIIDSYAETNTDVSFHFIADNRVKEVEIDREQIRRLFINLLDNALISVRKRQKSEDCNSKVFLKTEIESQNLLRMEVVDSGYGISDNDKSQIFDPYFTTESSGTGLGLAIVSTIVSEHNGEIKVFDSEMGGAKFVIELPIYQDMKGRKKRIARGV